MQNEALILVDIQNDYFDGGLWPQHEMDRASANAAKLLAAAREKGMPVIHIRHEMASESAPFFRPGSHGAEIHPSVAPREGEAVILKHRPNSFQDTGLYDLLKEKGIESVTICGAMSQMCIDATTRAAVDFGFPAIVVEDACGAKATSFNGTSVPAPQVHAAFMASLASSYGKVLTTQAWLER